MPLIHTYIYGDGGLGDFLRSLFAYYVYCKNNNIKFYLLINDHPFKYCFEKQKIPEEYIKNLKLFYNVGAKNNETIRFLEEIKNNDNNYIVRSNVFDFIKFEEFSIYKKEFIEFLNISPFIKKRIKELKKQLPLSINNFSSIHIRCGDKFMNNINIYSDERVSPYSKEIYDKIENSIIFLKNIEDIPIIIFSDNNNIKNYIKSNHIKNTNIYCFDVLLNHTSLKTNNEIIGTIDTVSEFFLLGQSKNIVSLSNSGFSFWTSFINEIPLYKYDKEIELFTPDKLKY